MVMRTHTFPAPPDGLAAIGMPMTQAFPWMDAYQCTHVKLFPRGVFHAENVGGQVDAVLDQRVWPGGFPFRFKGGEAAFRPYRRVRRGAMTTLQAVALPKKL